jgi:hypothetical protein
MEVNALPKYDMSDNPTGCCPRFKSEAWDGQELHFRNKPFLKATTRSLFHIPLNMGPVFSRTFAAIQGADAFSDENFVVLSCDPSAWKGEHYFAVTHAVAGQEMVTLSGDYLTKVFEGPYGNVPKWAREMEKYAREKGRNVKKTYFFYTTCPKCAKVYGKNYVVGVAEVGA